MIHHRDHAVTGIVKCSLNTITRLQEHYIMQYLQFQARCHHRWLRKYVIDTRQRSESNEDGDENSTAVNGRMEIKNEKMTLGDQVRHEHNFAHKDI